MADRPLFRQETIAEIENTLSRTYLANGIRTGREVHAFIALALLLACCTLFVDVSLDVMAVGIFRGNTDNRFVISDRDGLLTYAVSGRSPVDVSKGEKIASIRNFDTVTLRQAPNVTFSRSELQERRNRLQARVEALKAAMVSKAKALRQMLTQLQTLKDDADKLATVYRDDAARLSKRESDYKQLLEKGLVTALAFENVAQALSDRNVQLSNTEANAHEYERRMTEVELQLDQAADDSDREQVQLQNQITDIDVAMQADAELEEQPVYADRAATLIPKGYAVGQAVKRGDILFELTSGTDTLEIEADVPESQIGELHEGMPVTIGVSSYPIFKYGMMSGKVTFVSSVATDAVTFSERLPTASQFRMVIKPDPASFMAFSEDKKILPGMLAEVHVRKKKVAIWRLLLAPFLRLSYRMDT
jgi:hypothetical protein